MNLALLEARGALTPVAAFLATSLVVGVVLSAVLRRWQRRPGRNVVTLRGKRRRRSWHRIRLPRVHPLAWLIGFGVLAYAYMLHVEEPPRSGARSLAGAVTHVRDGDTVEVAGVPIRFAKLDCAELGTADGERAKQAMARLVSGRRLQCELTGRRSYDRMIGECNLTDGRSLSEIMIRERHCGRWR